MGELLNLYNNIESPLRNPQVIQKIISAWAKDLGQTGIYDSLMKMRGRNDKGKINLSDREEFFVNAYNDYIETILNLPEDVVKGNPNLEIMKRNLASIGKVQSMQDIEKLVKNKYITKLEILDGGWEHIKSASTRLGTEKEMDIKHRLYVSCQNKDMYKLMNLFRSKCKGKDIPYYFKAAPSENRDDEIVIYSDTQHLSDYIEILKEIEMEAPEIISECGKPPLLTGKVNEWIGIGDEPPELNGEKRSYNEMNAGLIEPAIKDCIVNSIEEYKGKMVKHNGIETKFNDIILEISSQYMVEHLGRLSNLWLNQYGITKDEIGSDSLKNIIREGFKKNLSRGLQALRDDNSTTIKDIFSIPTKSGKSIDVTSRDMEIIIRKMAPIMQQVDPQLAGKVKAKIEEICMKNDRDVEKFCFQQGTRQRFETADKNSQVQKRSTTEKSDTNQQKRQQFRTQTTQTMSRQQVEQKKAEVNNSRQRQRQTNYYEKSQQFRAGQNGTLTPQQVQQKKNIFENRGSKQEQTKTINTIDIVDMLNPTLMSKMIELPNGAKIPARQYIQEAVAPHIPSNGKFILKNGAEISAKQYLEEYILGEGQQKYKGDIGKLMAENTRANNGTIISRGQKINVVSIVDSLNPTLMGKMVNLPNGAKIPASQYVQEVVAPYIPSNGKFILKNGAEIPATQFIEEAVMFVGQEKYNGDINALLNAMTVANNGTVSVGTDTKPPKGHVKRQEMGGVTKTTEETTTRKSTDVIMGQAVKKSLSKKAITTSEANKVTSRMGEREERKKLNQAKSNGTITPEQQQRLNELNRKLFSNPQHIPYQQQGTRKNKGQGMSR